jgi:diguanylate cyclase (GGDEF)-like protein/PAS domain S-box-containing protein
MDEVITNVASLGLLVLLFTAIVRRAPDDRLRCWVAGWFCILLHTSLKLWTPSTPVARLTSVCAGIDALALAAICLLVSAKIVREGRKSSLRLGGSLALFTLPCLTMAIAHPRPAWLLATLVIARQGVAAGFAIRPRPNRRLALIAVLPACTVSLIWMLRGITMGHIEYVLLALLAEMFFVAAANFWFNGWERTLGLSATCIGLVGFAAVFPAAVLIGPAWPRIPTDLAGLSAFCAAVGMILIVLEEDGRSARGATEEYRLTFDTNPHPLWIYDAETLEFLAVNQAACMTHGYTPEEFARLRLPDIVETIEMPEILRQVALSAPISYQASRHLRKDRTVIPMDVTAHTIVFRGRPARFILGIDVSEREELQRQVLHHSRHDILTGLPNRALFEEHLRSALDRTQEAHEKLAILCLNLDRFTRINDTYGTAVGDSCLKQVAEILCARAGPKDLVARTAGDRFALVLTGLKTGFQAESVLLELRETFREPVTVGEARVRLSFTAGLALCPDDGIAVGALWRSAENALSRARTAGIGQVVWSNPDLHVVAEEQVELEAFMRVQLEEHGFRVAYQPLYAMDGQAEGLEALLRLNHPTRGPISPASFIPLAEETGLILPIGDWVLEEVCRQLSEWRERGIRLIPVSVNVSGLQLVQSGFAERLVAILSRFQVAPEQIVLEVTESSDMLNVAQVTRQMEMLSDIGIRFAIDDFGTGHSTLNRLDKLPLRVLKVDRTFTDRLCQTNGSRSIVQAMISMAKALNMEVVAEGVEFEEQLAVLREMGCDYMQGFLLSRPLLPAGVPEVVRRPHPLLSDPRGFPHPIREFRDAS